jgi:hypothetical protein
MVTKKLIEELNKGVLRYIWHEPKVNGDGTMCKIKGRFRGTESHNLFIGIRDKRSLIFYCDRKFVWVREVFTGCCTRNVRCWLARFIADNWKLRRVRIGYEKERRSLYRGK